MTPAPLRAIYWALAAAAIAAGVLGFVVKAVLEPSLPSVSELREIKLPVPLRVFSADGKLIGEFGSERREPLRYADFPKPLVQAFLAAEDDRFFEHPGVDWQGLVRAMFSLLATGEKSQGGSTITMQLARNVFLSSERTFTRKAKEILLALKIEEEMSKEEILETYLNKIYLGQRAYGVGVAAQIYFGKDVTALTLDEAAVLAGLPKAPSRDNPISNPERAKERRDYVLRRMHDVGYINDEQRQQAQAQPLLVREPRPAAEVDAYYVAEMARLEVLNRYGDAAYDGGYTVITTIDSKRQVAANDAVRAALRDYEVRRGWRGPEARLSPDAQAELTHAPKEPRPLIAQALGALPDLPGLPLAVVLDASADNLQLWTREAATVEVAKADFAWAQFNDKSRPARGDVVRVHRVGTRWTLAQMPRVQGALVALDPRDGSVQALTGGYDYFSGKFNRVTQARRQPGSGFKPFLYAAAFASGYTPASVILDAPVVFDDPALESAWRPENYGGNFNGPTRLREALVQSRNLVSIRLMQGVGIGTVRNFAARFGLPIEQMPQDLTLSLGTPTFTPMEMARAYAVLANGGRLVDPYFVQEVRDGSGTVLFRANPARACLICGEDDEPDAPTSETSVATASPGVEDPAVPRRAPRVADPRAIWLTRDILRDAVTRGTGAKVRELGRNDLAGKTGTTNDETDAWFDGFHSTLAAVAWVGYDQPTPLGRGEVGGRAALPIWMDFMKVALRGVPETWPTRPSGLVSVRINPETGRLATADTPGAIHEILPMEALSGAGGDADAPATETPPDDLF